MRDDPEGAELRATEKGLSSFKDKDVLEIGCGEGRFTAKFFGKTKSTVALDSDPNAIATARRKISSPSIKFLIGEAQKLELSSQSFDVVIFSWSLCCVEDPGKALKEAHRILRSEGALVNIMPDAVPTFETAMLQSLGQKDAIFQGSLSAFRSIVQSVKDGLFLPTLEEQRILFRTYFDNIDDDFVQWLPSKLGPFNQEEFKLLSKESLDAIKKFASTNLIQNKSLQINDALIVTTLKKI